MEEVREKSTTSCDNKPSDVISCDSKRRVLYDGAETKKTNLRGKRNKTLAVANVDQVQTAEVAEQPY